MKLRILSILMFSMLFTSNIFAQSLGEDDQSREAEDSGVFDEEEKGLTFGVLPHQWVDLTVPTKEATSFVAEVRVGGTLGDEGADRINMDMDFKYFGETYRQSIISLNGFLAFGVQEIKNLVGAPSFSVGAIPSPRLPNNIVAPCWADLSFEKSTGWIFYRTFHPEANDKTADHLVVQWEDAGFFIDPDSRVTFQVIFFNEGGIMFQYKEFKPSAGLIAEIKFWQEYGYGYIDSEGNTIRIEDLTEFEVIKLRFTLSIGFENDTGLKGASWNLPVTSGFTIGTDLVPDWVSASSGSNFLDIEDGRDRRNSAVTGSNGGACFISKKGRALDR